MYHGPKFDHMERFYLLIISWLVMLFCWISLKSLKCFSFTNLFTPKLWVQRLHYWIKKLELWIFKCICYQICKLLTHEWHLKLEIIFFLLKLVTFKERKLFEILHSYAPFPRIFYCVKYLQYYILVFKNHVSWAQVFIIWSVFIY